MKNSLTATVNGIISVILTLSLLWCCITSFSIEVNAVILIASTLIFTTVISLASAMIDSRKKYLTSLAVIGILFILTVLFSLSFVLSSANYTINCILGPYSQFLPVASSVSFSGNVSDNANVFFVFIAFILSFVFSASLIRLNKIFPVVILSVLCLVPSFILVNTLPSLTALLPVISCLFALYATTFTRKHNPAQNGNFLLISTSIILIVSIIICCIIPVENYKRAEWQSSMLVKAQQITGIKSYGGSGDGDSSASILNQVLRETQDLTEIGPTAKHSTLIMNVLAPENGNIYLRSASYANYNDNQWSLLNEEQTEAFPVNFDSFTMTKSKSDFQATMRIEPNGKSYLAYTPYFTLGVPEQFSRNKDINMLNKDRLTSYDITYVPYSQDEEFYTSYTSSFVEYKNFVYDNYLDMPSYTKRKLLDIAKDNGISIELSGISEGLDDIEKAELLSIPAVRNDLVNDIKELISNHGSYSLNTAKMPFGRDFAVWFLNESETGYCVHYATAAALMLRAHGIPSRYVMGYYIKTEEGKWETVTSDNAHAWTEYFDDEKGWVPLEATPPSFEPSDYNDIDTIEPPPTEAQIATTESTTAKPTEATEPTTEVKEIKPEKSEFKFKFKLEFHHIVFFFITLIIFLIAFILLRIVFIRINRKNHFNKGRNNQRAIYIYRYIKLLDVFSNNIIPDEVIEVAQKASFSRHTVSQNEVNILLSYALDAKKELLRNSSLIRRIYLKIFVVI